jgi:hypothetical protein
MESCEHCGAFFLAGRSDCVFCTVETEQGAAASDAASEATRVALMQGQPPAAAATHTASKAAKPKGGGLSLPVIGASIGAVLVVVCVAVFAVAGLSGADQTSGDGGEAANQPPVSEVAATDIDSMGRVCALGRDGANAAAPEYRASNPFSPVTLFVSEFGSWNHLEEPEYAGVSADAADELTPLVGCLKVTAEDWMTCSGYDNVGTAEVGTATWSLTVYDTATGQVVDSGTEFGSDDTCPTVVVVDANDRSISEPKILAWPLTAHLLDMTGTEKAERLAGLAAAEESISEALRPFCQGEVDTIDAMAEYVPDSEATAAFLVTDLRYGDFDRSKPSFKEHEARWEAPATLAEASLVLCLNHSGDPVEQTITCDTSPDPVVVTAQEVRFDLRAGRTGETVMTYTEGIDGNVVCDGYFNTPGVPLPYADLVLDFDNVDLAMEPVL